MLGVPGGREEEKEMGELQVCLAFTSDDRKWRWRLAAGSVRRGGATAVPTTSKLWMTHVVAVVKLFTSSHLFFFHKASGFP